MFRLMIGIILFSFYSNTTLAAATGPKAECRVRFNGGGLTSAWFTLKNGEVTRFSASDIGGPWDFIQKTQGTCDFTVFNKDNFEGKRATYGEFSGVKSLWTGGKGGRDTGAWKTRSLIITPRKPTCYIQLAENESFRATNINSVQRRQTFYGPAKHNNITGWSAIQKVSQGCKYTVYNHADFSGRSHEATAANLTNRTKLDWRIRSIKIVESSRLPDPSGQDECRIKLGGGGKDSAWLTLKNGGVTRMNDIGGPWDFIRQTVGKCDFALFNKNNFEGRRATYGTGITKRLRVGSTGGLDRSGWKARSLVMTPRKSSCYMELAETEAKGSRATLVRKQAFYGPAEYKNITGWTRIKQVTQGCKYSVYSGVDFSGRSHEVTNLARVKKLGWRIRSIKIAKVRLPYKTIKHIKGRCLDVAGGVNKNGTNVQIYQCNNSASQKWHWGDNGEIKNAMGRCLDISNSGTVDSGSNVEIRRCLGSRSQRWQKVNNHKVRNSRGFCLDLANGRDANGTNVQLYQCKSVNAQKWQY